MLIIIGLSILASEQVSSLEDAQVIGTRGYSTLYSCYRTIANGCYNCILLQTRLSIVLANVDI